MEYDLASFVQQQSPEQRQQMLAEVMRQRSRSAALQGANQQAHQFDPLAAIAPLLGNPGAITAANTAAKNASAQHKPLSLGPQGFALPSSGDFVPSPIYEQEQDERRQARSDLANQSQETKRHALSQTLEAQANRAAEAEQGRRDRAQQSDETRRLIASQGNALRETLAAIRGAAAGERRSDKEAAALDKAATKKSADLDKSLVKYAQFLDKTGVPDFDAALATAEGTLAKYEKGKLPGYGTFESLNPGWGQTEIQTTRADMQQAANILLKARSGAAVTDSEMRRFLTEVSQGKGMTEEAMRHGWDNVRKTFDMKRSAITAGFGPEVHDEFMVRGGKDYRFNANAPKPGAASPAAADPPPKGIDPEDWKHVSPEDKKKWKR